VLGITYGFMHCEFRIDNKTKEPILMEINPRPSGGDIFTTYINEWGDFLLDLVVSSYSKNSIPSSQYLNMKKKYLIWQPMTKKKINTVYIDNDIYKEKFPFNIDFIYSLCGRIYPSGHIENSYAPYTIRISSDKLSDDIKQIFLNELNNIEKFISIK
jgi:hypothetical protein